MATTLASLVVKVGADVKDAVRGFSQFDDRLKKTRTKLTTFESTTVSLTKTLGIMAGAAGVGFAAKKVFDLGAAVEETASKFRTVFGPETQAAQQFLDDFATTAGLTIREGQELLATTGAIAQGMGFSQSASAAFAEEITRLSGDLSSFNNIPIAETSRAIQAALTGEREQLKRLGIVIREADVQQRALAESGKAAAAELTQQEKAAATLALISERAGVAVGDLARTQDSAANQARRVSAEIRSFRDALAQGALPALNEILAELARATGAEGFSGLTDKVRANSEIIAAWTRFAVESFKTVAQAIQGVVSTAFNLGQIFGDVLRAAFAALRGDLEGAKDILSGTAQNFADIKAEGEDVVEGFDAMRMAAGDAFQTFRDDVEVIETTSSLLAEQRDELEATADSWERLAKSIDGLDASDLRAMFDPGKGFIDPLGSRPRFGAISTGRVQGLSPEAMESVRRAGEEADRALREASDAVFRFSEEVDRDLIGALDDSVRSIAGLADNLGILDGAGRDAARAISDIIGSIDSLRSGGGGLLGKLPGIAGIVGGAIGVIGGLFGGGDEEKARIEAQRRREAERRRRIEEQLRDTIQANTEAVERLRSRLEGRGRTVQDMQGIVADITAAIEGISLEGIRDRLGGLPDVGDLIPDLIPGGGRPGIPEGLEPVRLPDLPSFPIPEMEDLITPEMRRLARELGIELKDQFGNIIPSALDDLRAATELLIEELERAESRFMRSLKVERLRLKGLDEQAAALARQIDLEKRIAGLRKQGFSETAIAAFKEIEALKELERAREAEAERLRQRRDFQLDVEKIEAELAGDARRVLEIDLRRQTEERLRQAQKLLDAGTITVEMFRRMEAALTNQVNKALADFERQARRAEQADKDALRIRILLAEGRNKEVEALRDMRELQDAVIEGRDAEFMALLRQAQAAERAKRAQDDLTNAMQASSRVLNAPAGLRLSLLRFRSAVERGQRDSFERQRSAPVREPRTMRQVTQHNRFGDVVIRVDGDADPDEILAKWKVAMARTTRAGGVNPAFVVPAEL